MVLLLVTTVFADVPGSVPAAYVGSSGYDMLLVAAGTFEMGSDKNEEYRDDDERKHTVVLTHSFYMGRHEVSQRVWSKLMADGSKFDGDSLPAENMTWFDAAAFANAMSDSEGLEQCYVISKDDVTWPKGYDCTGYRLPTEAEWEYAALGGKGGIGGDLLDVAWVKNNSDKKTHPVGQKAPNGYGLHDMLGNVCEWVWDLHEDYPRTESVDPIGAVEGDFHIRRGGGFSTGAPLVRTADRYSLNPYNQHNFLGVRLVRTAP